MRGLAPGTRDLWHRWAWVATAYDAAMSVLRRIDPDVVTGVLIFVLCAVVGLPIAVLQLTGQDPTLGPIWLWWATFALYLASYATGMWMLGLHRSTAMRVLLGVQVVTGPAAVLLAPDGAGWIPILLVFTAATSVYVVSRWTTAAIILLNTVVVGIASVGQGEIEIAFSAGLYLLIQAVSVLAIDGQLREERVSRELAETHTELRATTALLADRSRQAERLRIARDLHDVVGHQLTALALELEIASHHADDGPAGDHVARSRDLVKDLLGDVRATVGELREQPLSLRDTLEAIASDLPRPQVHVVVDEAVTLDDERATTLVRCAQEIVTNAIRHSDAHNLWLTVTPDDDGGVRLTGRDDGAGTSDLALGNGLQGLRERVEQLGGRATFTSTPSFEVVAQLPATAPAKALA